MAKCKYPDVVCANMTRLHRVAYCNSVPCSMKDELPKQTNADWIRSLNNVKLAKLIDNSMNFFNCNKCSYGRDVRNSCKKKSCLPYIKEWLESEVEE